MKKWFLYIGTVFLVTLCSCAFLTQKPITFMKMEPTWVSIEIREGLEFERAWEEVIDVLAKKFELEMISKEGGYVRTSWIYTWWKEGEFTKEYRVRAVVKFTPNRKKVDIKTEAHYLKGDVWILGYDTRLLQTIKTDIMGVIGRVTR